ncbi:MAG TPA: permease-like cell division protein FtsX [Thermoanaerobaculia bacterium]|nr:permease-like cell division protein FtsX [Thermoanaerobaculia bacterium]
MIMREENVRPMGTFGYFFMEASRRLWISRRNSLVAIAMIVFSLFILGTFLLISENLGRAVDQQRGRSRMVIYLHQDATEDQIADLRSRISGERSMRNPVFISSDEAVERFRQSFPSLASVLGELEDQPFPASFEVTVSEEAIGSRAFYDRVGTIRDHPAVDDLQFDWEWVNKLRELVRMINLTGIVVGGILGIAAVFMIANVIRLTMVLYREEIGVMRLVGATETIIRGPFMVEGLLQGTLGGLCAAALLAGAYFGGKRLLDPAHAFVWDILLQDFLSLPKLAAITLAGILAGVLGSWLAVRETAAT